MAGLLCATRARKNLLQLRGRLPIVFPTPEPAAGYASIVPLELLGRLHRMSGGARARLPAPLLGQAAELPLVRPTESATSPLFSGTLWIVSLKLTSPAGLAAVSAADIAVAQEFAKLAAPSISRYAAQYGPNAVSDGGRVLDLPVTVQGTGYNDQTLQQWANTLAQQSKIPTTDALVFLNPPGVGNTDAPVAQGVLGYHGMAQLPYIFVNVLGSGFSVADPHDQFALALSHEIAEMVVDPRADASNPEVCDPCGPNCQTPIRDYFDGAGTYLGSTTAFPPPYPYAFFLNAIVQPVGATACPAQAAQCTYAPP